MEIVSREDAIKQGLKRYFTGEPCERGHIAERWVCNGLCVVCHKDYYQANYDKIIAYQRDYYHANKAQLRANYQANRDKILAQKRAYRQANKKK